MHDLHGIPIIESEFATIDRILVHSHLPGLASSITAHPLDVIAMRYPRDPHARLDEAMVWIVTRAHRKLDALAQQLDRDADADREAVAAAERNARITRALDTIQQRSGIALMPWQRDIAERLLRGDRTFIARARRGGMTTMQHAVRGARLEARVWHDEHERYERTGHLDQGGCWCDDCIAKALEGSDDNAPRDR